MASAGSYADKLSEISGDLAVANAYMAMAMRPDAVLNAATGSLSGIEACVAKLAIAVPGITSWGITDSNTSRIVVGAMTSFVNELSGIFVDLFVPVDFEADPDSLAGSVNSYMKAVLSSLTNPVAAVIATQQNLLTQSLGQIKGILYNDVGGKDRGFLNQYSDRIERIFKSLFFGDADLNIAGMILFAIEEAIPAIEMEFVYLRRLKRLAKSGLEDVANLPDILSPTMMNSAVTSKLCCADEHLRKVEDQLRRDNIFNRKEWGLATKCVCSARDTIFSGSVDADFINFHAGNLAGLSSAQIKSLTSLRFMPNIQFRLNIIQINLFINAFEEADRDTRTLHNNMLQILDLLDQLAQTRIGDLMALIVQLLRKQINGVQADLEAQAQGFSGYNDALTESKERKKFYQENKGSIPAGQIDAAATAANDSGQVKYQSGLSGTTLSKEVSSGSKGGAFGPQQTDIYAYMSAQASAYVVLSAACFIMDKTSSIFGLLDKVLSSESKLVKFLQNFVGDMRTKCPQSQGGAEVVTTTAAYVRALEDRLNGKTTSNTAVVAAAQQMIRRITEYEKFLTCFKRQLFFGNEALMALVTSLAAALAAYRLARALIQQIKMIIRLYPQLKQMYKTLDLAKMLGVGVEYNALDTIVGALQCLVLQCDNPFVTDLVSSAASQFQNEFAKRRSDAITMGSLDEIPKTGMMSVIMKRIQAIQRLIQLINSITNFDIKDLCAIKTPATTPISLPSFKLPADEDPVVDTAPWRKSLIESGVRRQPDGTIR